MVRFTSDDHSLDHSYDATYVHDHDMDFASVNTWRTNRSCLSTSTFASTFSKERLTRSLSNESLEGECVEIDVNTFLDNVEHTDNNDPKKSGPKQRPHWPRSRLWCLLLSFACMSCGIALCVFFFLKREDPGRVNESNAMISQGVNEPPLSEAGQFILDVLDEFTAKEVLLNASLFQGQLFLDLVSREEQANVRTPVLQLVQKYALLALYRSTSGKGWGIQFGWETQWTNLCKWYGIKRCTELPSGEMAISDIDLASNGLKGFIPKEICALGKHLKYFDLSENYLSGTIPACISSFHQLETLVLRSNELGGGLPPHFLTIPTLQFADFSHNQLAGPLDVLFEPESSTSSALTVNIFNVADNALTGEIPSEFSNFSAILMFANNSLSGYLENSFCSNGAITVDCQLVNCSCCVNCRRNV